MTRPIVFSVLAALLGAIVLPVQGYSQEHIFFNASDKYRDWFHEPLRQHNTRSEKTNRWFRLVSGASSTAVKYPYPDKAFVMTEKIWLKSANAAIYGKPDWYDVEVVRQRAEVEEYVPAMDLLGWMYQEGRGLRQDLRKAYNMYERAKLAGKLKVRGNTAKIFDRLTQPEQLVAQIQLLDDIKRMKPDKAPAIRGIDQVNLYIMKQQRNLNVLRQKRKLEKKRSPGPLGLR